MLSKHHNLTNILNFQLISDLPNQIHYTSNTSFINFGWLLLNCNGRCQGKTTENKQAEKNANGLG